MLDDDGSSIEPAYMRLAQLANKRAGSGNLGMVVGATATIMRPPKASRLLVKKTSFATSRPNT